MYRLSIRETLQQINARGTPPLWLYRVRREMGKSVFRLNIPLFQHFVVVCDAEATRTILNNPRSEKTAAYKPIRNVTGGIENIFTKMTYGEGWEHARKGSALAFTSAHIFATMDACAPHLADLDIIMTGHAQRNEPIPVSETMMRLTVDIIGSTGFGGFAMNALRGPDETSDGRQFLHDLEIALVEFTSKYVVNPLRRFKFWDAEVIKAKACSRRMMRLAQRIIDVYRASGKAGQDSNSLIAHLCNNDYRDDRDRCADVLIYLLAGHDTTGNSIAWTLYELARNPEIQDKLAADVAQNGTNSPYLQLVIKESLRLHPAVALGSIRASGADVPTADGCVIPAGSWCLCPFYVIFREEWIEHPLTFLPSRWAAGSPQREDLERLVFPFSLGRRDCIGQRMAMAQLRTVLAHILPRYRLAVAQEPIADYFLTLKPAHALLHVSIR